MLKNLKNAEFSKKLIVFVEALILALFVLVTIATFKGLVDALVAMITGVFSLASIAFGFYFWKAKNENIRKYAKGLNSQDIEKVLKMYDAIFKEDNLP
jgi:heme O synthase-like polyprenyltransferase